ncbi:MAG TPA: hypothetical protein VGR30_06390 [Candidatus Binatia bacterium]|jgi:hypothetical protein|nr:hypothetical protein [Candidatus Binatia bacterium]
MKLLKKLALGSVLSIALTALVACEHISLISLFGGPRADPDDEIVAEVERLDSRNMEIYIRPEGGRTGIVRYDAATRVMDRGREHPVTYLQPGDIVAFRMKTDSRGELYADLIFVRETNRERRIGSASRPETRIQTLDGTVERVDQQRGVFEIRDGDGRQVTVSLPYKPQGSDIERFERLRIGDRVSIEGHFISQDRFELEAFIT